MNIVLLCQQICYFYITQSNTSSTFNKRLCKTTVLINAQKGDKIVSDSTHFSISEFAKYSLLTRDTLLHYDRIGLLQPAIRGENNYRYYSDSQISVATYIRTLQKLGMSLDDIKDLKDRRTPELAEVELERHLDWIDEKIDDWIRARNLLLKLQKTLLAVKNIDESVISVQFMPAEAIILGELNDYSQGRTTLDVVYSYYDDIRQKFPNLELNYFVGAAFSEDRIKNRDWIGADRYYMYHQDGYDMRPASLYAIGYIRSGYVGGKEIYNKLIDYIETNGFEICGCAYEECLLNEVFIIEPDNYLKRVMIRVREKDKA